MFYSRLSELCKTRGTSISRFSVEILGLNKSTPNGWKNGSSPSADVVIASARHFGVSADYLLGLSNDMKSEGGLSAEEVGLLSAWHAAPPILRGVAMNVLRTSLPEEGETSSPSRTAGIPDAL